MKGRTEDPQASQRSTKLTKGIIKSVANDDITKRMTRDMQKALPFVSSQEDIASAAAEVSIRSSPFYRYSVFFYGYKVNLHVPRLSDNTLRIVK